MWVDSERKCLNIFVLTNLVMFGKGLIRKLWLISKFITSAKKRSFCTQKMKFSIKDFFSKHDQIRTFLRIWSHLLNKSLMENFIFHAVIHTLPNISRQ